MKKLLFLLLSAAVAISASAGIDFKQAKKGMVGKTPVAVKADKKTKLDKKSPIKILDFAVRDNHVDVKERSRGASDVIYDQPAGTLRTYARSEDGLCVIRQSSGLGIYIQDSENVVNIVYDNDGQTVWIQDICAYLDFDTWVRGTISGNKIHVPLGQFISWYDAGGYGRILAWGTFVNGEGYVNDNSVTEVTYTINGNVLTMDNTSFDEVSYNMTGLTTIWDDDLTWGNYLEALTVLTTEGEPEPEPTIYPNVQDLTVVPGVTTADVTWTDPNCDEWYLRYRESRPGANYYWDFETEESWGEWSSVDLDGDGFDWFPAYFDEEGMCPSGTGFYASYCYDPDSYAPLTPEDYLISPDVILHGEASFYAWGVNPNYAEEHFIAYVLTDDGLIQISEETEVNDTPTKYTFDLSEFEGQEGALVICHTGCTDLVALAIDDVFIGDPNSDVYADNWHYVYELDETNYLIEGLTPETTYEVQVVGFADDGHSYWCDPVEFTTLADTPAIPDVYMLGGDDQAWEPSQGTKFDYNAEDNIYTATITFPANDNYFAFTTQLAETPGDWDAIAPYRFGALSNGNFDWHMGYNGQPLDLTTPGEAFHIAGGKYDIVVDLSSMKIIITTVETPHGFDPGDVNHSGSVNIADVTALIDYLLGSGTVCEICADVRSDGQINIGDVTALIDLLLGSN